MLRTYLSHLCLLAALIAGRFGFAAEPVVTTDLLRVRTVSSIDVARNGSRAVFAVQSVGEVKRGDETTWSNQSHVYTLDLSRVDAVPRCMTFGDRRDGSPSISPDGRRIAFLRADPETGKVRVWVMAADGGEARPVSDPSRDAQSPQWSPDGRRILYAANVPFDELEGTPPFPSERPQRRWDDAGSGGDAEPAPAGSRDQIRAWLAENADELEPNVITRLRFQGEQTLRGRPAARHLFLIDPDDAESGAERITDGFYDCVEAAFMPDGQTIVYASKKRTGAHPDRVREMSLRRVSIETGEERELLAPDGWSLSRPRPSLDGSVLAFIGRRMDEPMFRQRQLGMASITREGVSEPVWLTDSTTFDRTVASFQWHQARAALLFTAFAEGGMPLLTIDPGLLEPALIVDVEAGLPVNVSVFDAGGGAVVYAMGSIGNPCVLRVRDGRGDRLAMDLNPWVKEKQLATARSAWLSRPDGVRVQYWLMEPTRREEDERYPLAVEIHGGPNWMWGPGTPSMWLEFQLLSSWGYGVVYANPRGSTGYGYEFQRGNLRNWGQGPGGDVLAVVDHVLLEPWVDPDRLVITGGSYGGYLTAWIIANDRRFKAAVAQRGVYDFRTFFGEGNAFWIIGDFMGGEPWQPALRQLFDRESPFSLVNRIRTPLLILHGDNDLRTGVSQSAMMYRALKQMERPVEYVRYPASGHDLSRSGTPRLRMDRLNRIIEFFERHIENERPAPRSESNDS